MKTPLFALAAALFVGTVSAQLVEVNIAQNKPTFGDVAFGAPTSRGVDGIDGTENPGNWTHADFPTSAVPYPGEVDLAPNPFWQVDFGEPFDLTRIQLVDRVGCCDPQRLEGSTITLFNFEGEVVGSPIEVTGLLPSSTPENAVLDYDNGGNGWAAVQAVRIDGLDTNQYFQFSEFRAFSLQEPPPPTLPNAALGAPVTASGGTWGGQPASHLTDGNLSTFSHPLDEFGTLGFTYTVDMGISFNLEEIVLWNRDNCCPERLSNYRVSLHEDNGAGAPGPAVWMADVRTDGSNSPQAGSDSLTAELDPDGTFAGQFIIIENLSDAPYNPQLAEVEARTLDDIPEPPQNFALGAAAGFFNGAGQPVGSWGSLPVSNVTDGIPSTISHPLDMISADYYLEIDLGADVLVGVLDVTGRTDGCCPERLVDAVLELLDEGMNVVASTTLTGEVTTTQTFDFSAAPPVARFVRVRNANGADYGPQVGEVAVYAPTGPVAPFEITAFSVDPETGVTELTFNSAPGANYAVFASSTLSEGEWEEIDDNIPSQGTETTAVFVDSFGAGAPSRLYHVVRN